MLLDARLNMNQQCALIANKANSVLGCITRSIDSKTRKKYSPLRCSGRNSPGMLYLVWGPLFKKDVNGLAGICKVNGQAGQQPTAHKLGLLQQVKGKLRGYITAAE